MTNTKFIGQYDIRITQEVDGFGLGFPHVGLHKVAADMGYGAVGSSSWITNVESRGSVIGWLVTVETR
jgi:hypothetical protein